MELTISEIVLGHPHALRDALARRLGASSRRARPDGLTPEVIAVAPYKEGLAFRVLTGRMSHVFGSWRMAKDMAEVTESLKGFGIGVARVKEEIAPEPPLKEIEPEMTYLMWRSGPPDVPSAGKVLLPEGVDIPLGGNCPVQGEGFFFGFPAYFRARGCGWSLEVQLTSAETWSYQRSPWVWPEGGWITETQALDCLVEATAAFENSGVALTPRRAPTP